MLKKVTVLGTSLAWPAWAGCSWAELFLQPSTNFFAQLIILALQMKEIVILTMNAKQTLSVVLQIVVQHILDLHLMTIVVPM